MASTHGARFHFNAPVDQIQVENGMATVTIVDMNGQQLLRRQISVQKGTGQHTIPVEQFSSGQYILHFTQNGFTDQKPFLIVK